MGKAYADLADDHARLMRKVAQLTRERDDRPTKEEVRALVEAAFRGTHDVIITHLHSLRWRARTTTLTRVIAEIERIKPSATVAVVPALPTDEDDEALVEDLMAAQRTGKRGSMLTGRCERCGWEDDDG